MSSRVRASKRSWMSELERTVSGILINWSEQVQSQMLWVVFVSRVLLLFDAL